jgi:hypothetical protein
MRAVNNCFVKIKNNNAFHSILLADEHLSHKPKAIASTKKVYLFKGLAARAPPLLNA